MSRPVQLLQQKMEAAENKFDQATLSTNSIRAVVSQCESGSQHPSFIRSRIKLQFTGFESVPRWNTTPLATWITSLKTVGPVMRTPPATIIQRPDTFSAVMKDVVKDKGIDAVVFGTTRIENGSLSNFFSGCPTLKAIDMFFVDVSNVTSLFNAFNSCSGLEHIDVSSWDTSHVRDMSQTFAYCRGLTVLNLSGWDTRQVINLQGMFSYCENLTAIDMSSARLDSLGPAGGMFVGCAKLKTIWMRGDAIKKLATTKPTAEITGIENVDQLVNEEVYTLQGAITNAYPFSFAVATVEQEEEPTEHTEQP